MSLAPLGLAVSLAAVPLQDAAADLGQIRLQLVGLEILLRQAEGRLAGVETRLGELSEALEERAGPERASPAASYAANPPPPSDAAGFARASVFAPRLAVDSAVSHDLILVRLRRLEADEAVPVAELDMGADPDGLPLPVDVSGALYLVEWSTSEGYAFDLILRDGLSGQAAATVKVKPRESRGHFVFVGFRVD